MKAEVWILTRERRASPRWHYHGEDGDTLVSGIFDAGTRDRLTFNSVADAY